MTTLFNHILKKYLYNKNIKNGSLIKGTVIQINKNNVLVDTKLKSESTIPITQFINNKGNLEIKLNDEINVILETIENGYGETIISREKAKIYELWKNIYKFYKNNKNIIGFINNKVKGGYTVDLNGLKAFLPGSLIDIKPIKDNIILEGQTLEFKIIKLDKYKNNIVISRKAVLLEENQYKKEQLLTSIYEGLIIKGLVKNLTNYGAFIDLGGLDGLLHITDMSWKRIKHPTELLQIGNIIKVKIIKFDQITNRVSLGLKQLTPDPWDNINNKYPINSITKGHITNLTEYGCFIQIAEGIEGLAHITEIDWMNKNINPINLFHIGDTINTMILNIDTQTRRISLGIKQCTPNPWKLFKDKYKKGEQTYGIVKSITDFGIFIILEYNINGLIHISDIQWHLKENLDIIKTTYPKGSIIRIMILQIDINKNRISLGIKQLTKDPLNIYSKIYQKNKTLSLHIKKITDKFIQLNLKHQLIGYILINKISSTNSKKYLKTLKKNDLVYTKITKIDTQNRTIYFKLHNILIKKITQKLLTKEKIKQHPFFNTIMMEAFKKAKTE